MISNYVKVAFRTSVRQKLYTLINVAGLAIGLSASIFIYLYVDHELSFDRHHPNAERIYRINEFITPRDGSPERSSSVPFPMGDQLKEDNPGMIEEVVRFFDFQSPIIGLAYEPAEKEFNERNLYFVDSTFGRLFQFKLLKGNPATALDGQNSVVLTETTSRKYFGDDDPIGKTLRLQGRVDLLVTGIMPDGANNSHIKADILVSFSTLKHFYNGAIPTGWYWNPCWTYVLLREGVKPGDIEGAFPGFVQKHLPEFIRNDVTLRLQPLTDIHLTSNLDFEMEANGDISNVNLFSGIAIIILIIAGINYMNLATAKSMIRAKEIGMRKTYGGLRYQLILQFLGESIIISLLSVVVAIIMVALLLEQFEFFTGKQLSIDLTNPWLLGKLLLIGVGLGTVSGIYPAVFLSSMSPLNALKSIAARSGVLSLRKSLVIVQFSISIILLISTAVAYRQLEFLRSDDTGFRKEAVVLIPVIRTPMGRQFKAYKDEVLKHASIYAVTALEEILGAKHQSANYQFEGMNQSALFSHINVRHDFLKTFDIPLIAGRDYDESIGTDDSLALVVNESLVKSLGLTPEAAIGKRILAGGPSSNDSRIIGVARDFNFVSKHSAIGALALPLNVNPGAFNLFIKYMAVRINPENAQEAISVLESKWKELIPNRAFEYFFLDDELNNLYKAEQNMSKVTTAMAILAVVVACLGLFGLTSFNTEQRRREISIRKVLGCSSVQVVWLIFADVLKLMVLAIVVACPLAYAATYQWLEKFAYRIDIPLSVFLVVPLVAVVISFLTVGYKTWLAAQRDPAIVLRDN